MASSPTTSWHIDEGDLETVADFIFLGSIITMDLDCSHKIKRHLLLGRKKGYEKPEQCIKKQRLILLQRSVVSQLWFSSNHVQMWDLELSFWTAVLEKILESPLYNKEIKQVNLKGNQPLTPAVLAEASTEGLQV